MIFESIPQQVQAIQWTGHNVEEILDFGAPVCIACEPPLDDGYITLELTAGVNGVQGLVPLPIGHWIVGRLGEIMDFWPVEDNYFQNKYRAV